LMRPAAEIGEICSRHDVLYLLDACQSIGQCRLDTKKLHCDFLSVTSRKFLRGPRGAGFLYVSDKALNQGLEPLFIDMRGADWIEKDLYKQKDGAIRFEDWEFAYALLLGTGAAIDYLLRLDISTVEKQVQYLSSYLREGLGRIHGVTIHDKGKQRAGLVTFHLKDADPDFIKRDLSAKKINVVTSIRDYAVIDYDEKGVDWTIRVSPHYFNTPGELDIFVEQVSAIAKSRF
jgi:selenocysteine lyase/cysteine desulfurase